MKESKMLKKETKSRSLIARVSAILLITSGHERNRLAFRLNVDGCPTLKSSTVKSEKKRHVLERLSWNTSETDGF